MESVHRSSASVYIVYYTLYTMQCKRQINGILTYLHTGEIKRSLCDRPLRRFGGSDTFSNKFSNTFSNTASDHFPKHGALSDIALHRLFSFDN